MSASSVIYRHSRPSSRNCSRRMTSRNPLLSPPPSHQDAARLSPRQPSSPQPLLQAGGGDGESEPYSVVRSRGWFTPDAKHACCVSVANNPSSWVRSFLDRAADGPQVLTEGQVRIPRSVLQERRELDLLPKGVPVPDSLGLPPLGVTDAFGNVEDLGHTVIGEEHGSIVVCEDNVAGADHVLADAGRHERLRVPRRQLQRSGRDRAQAEHWQP